MQNTIRRIQGEIRLRMIEARDYYRDALESIRDESHEAGTELFRGWLEAKMKEAERTILELTPKTLLPPSAITNDPDQVEVIASDAR